MHRPRIKTIYIISIHSPHARGDAESGCGASGHDISIRSPHARGDISRFCRCLHSRLISIHSPHTRGDAVRTVWPPRSPHFNPLPSYEGRLGFVHHPFRPRVISIRSPLTRGDRISLQKSIRIYVSLHNKTMIHRFSELYKPLFAAQSPIFGVRSPRESHDSFTFARPSAGRGITP